MFLTEDKIIESMPKIWRHTLYPHILNTIFDMHELIYHANAWPDERANDLKKYLGQLSRLRSLSEIAHARRVLTHKQIGILDEKMESAEKQAAAWRKKTIEVEKMKAEAAKKQEDAALHGVDCPGQGLAGEQV